MASTMHVLDKTGDTHIIWNRGIKKEVDNAEKNFNLLLDSNDAYTVNELGEQGQRITKFDAALEKIIMIPKELVPSPPVLEPQEGF